jgi:uncharacterized protein (TIGR03086 family)
MNSATINPAQASSPHAAAARAELAADAVSTESDGTPAVPDPRPLMLIAARTASSVLEAVQDHDLVGPTPCSEFDVAALVDHLLIVAWRIGALGRGEDAFAADSEDPSGLSLADTKTEWAVRIAEAQRVWSDGTALAKTITMPWATLPGNVALMAYVSELTVHTWDVATATGQRPTWDDAVVGASLELMHAMLPGGGREHSPFGPATAVGANAPVIEQLAAWTGRVVPDFASAA